jgi:hypothetical protein
MGQNGIADFRSHPFFEGVDWDHTTSSTAPYIPEVRTTGTVGDRKKRFSVFSTEVISILLRLSIFASVVEPELEP